MTPEELAALNRAIANLFDRWKVGDDTGARILALEPHRYSCWKCSGLAKVGDDLKLRLVLFLNIHAQLRARFVDAGRGYAWMNRSNAIFGQSPVSLIAGGDLNALLRLQAYLAAETQAPL